LPPKVLMPAPEIAPLAKTGGLGDVTASLPPELARLGAEVRLVMPLYPSAAQRGPQPMGLELEVQVGAQSHVVTVHQTELNGNRVYLLDHPGYFQREHLYQDSAGDYPDNAQRFILLAKASLMLAQELDYQADIVHCHDWQTALIPAYLATGTLRPPALARARSVLTIHNLAYQGNFPRRVFGLTGLPPYLDSVGGMEFWGGVNFLKAGLVTADALTTVSPTYALEITTPQGGFGLEGVLGQRAGALHGILNGADYSVWSPEKDPLLPEPYRAGDMAGKQTCRQALCRALGLDAPEPDTAILGFVGRLTEQKGVDLILAAAPRLMLDDVRLCVLGTGDAHLQKGLTALAREHPGRVGVSLAFSEETAHLIQGGGDLLLMPSRFEPCGLNQLYAMSYGAAPVVRATGGLADTVQPFDPLTGQGVGFLFHEPSGPALLHAVREALWTKARPELWAKVVANAMARDFSWRASARSYLELYERLAAGA